MDVARSSSHGVAIHYVLLVLQMSSCFHIMGPIGGWMGTALSTRLPVVAAGGAQATVGWPACLLASSLAAQVAPNTTSPGHSTVVKDWG